MVNMSWLINISKAQAFRQPTLTFVWLNIDQAKHYAVRYFQYGALRIQKGKVFPLCLLIPFSIQWRLETEYLALWFKRSQKHPSLFMKVKRIVKRKFRGSGGKLQYLPGNKFMHFKLSQLELIHNYDYTYNVSIYWYIFFELGYFKKF